MITISTFVDSGQVTVKAMGERSDVEMLKMFLESKFTVETVATRKLNEDDFYAKMIVTDLKPTRTFTILPVEMV